VESKRNKNKLQSWINKRHGLLFRRPPGESAAFPRVAVPVSALAPVVSRTQVPALAPVSERRIIPAIPLRRAAYTLTKLASDN
jgi:hypothetical protein